MTMRTTSLKASLALTALTLTAHSMAIREYMFRQLPDAGFGGEARQISSYALNAHVAVCGSVRTAGGNIVAYEWDFNYNGSALAGLGGANSEAEDITHDSNGLVRIVGCAQNANSIWKGVLWREQPSGAFNLMVLPTLGGSSGDARCRVENSVNFGQNVRSFMGGWGQTAGGASRAELFVEMGNGSVTPVDLGTGGGANSYVNDVALNMDGATPVVHAFGATQLANGTWQACEWEIRENSFATGWDVLILLLPPGFGVSSETTGCGFFDVFTELSYCGTAGSPDGSTVAWLRVTDDNPARVITFPESHADAFNRSSSHATARTFGGALTVGEFHRDNQPPVGIVSYGWDLDNDGQFAETNEQNCRLGHELCPPDSSPVVRELCGITNVAIDDGLWYLCGSSWSTFPSSYRPCVLEPEARYMPDYVIRPGSMPLDESLLWFNDKRFLSNVPSRAGSGVSPLEVHFYELGDTATHEIGHFRMALRALGRNASGSMTVLAYIESTHSYTAIGTFPISGQGQLLSVPVDTSQFVSTNTRKACFKLMFAPSNSTTTGYMSGFMDYVDD